MTDKTVKTHLWLIGLQFIVLASLFFIQKQPDLIAYGSLVFTCTYLSLFALLPLVFFFSRLGLEEGRVMNVIMFVSAAVLKVFFLLVLFWLVLVRFEEFALTMLLFVLAAGALFVAVFVFEHFYRYWLDKTP